MLTVPAPISASAVTVTTLSPITLPESTHADVASIASSVQSPCTFHCATPSIGAGCPPGVIGVILSRIFSSFVICTSTGMRKLLSLRCTGPTCQCTVGGPVPWMVNDSPGVTRMVIPSHTYLGGQGQG